MTNITANRKDYIYTILLLAFTSFEFFFRESSLFFLLGFVAFVYFIFDKKKYVNNDITLVFAIMTTIFILQFMFIGRFHITSVVSRIGILLFSFAIATRIWNTFTKTFTKIIYVISKLSLTIYFTVLLFPGLKNFLINHIAPYFTSLNVGSALYDGGGINILIYNFQINDFAADAFLSNARNCGPFWEPGMFALFISIALYFNMIIFDNRNKSYTIIFILTLITTFSAGGFVSGAFVLFIYVLKLKSPTVKVFMALLLITAISYMVSLDIIGQKISDQISNVEVGNDLSRFSALLTQVQMIEASPIIGGENIEDYVFSEVKTLASGLLLIFVVYGIPFGLLLYYFIYKSCINIFNRYNCQKKYGILFFILLLIISVSQTIFTMSLMQVIMFIGLINFNKKNNKCINYAKL